MKSIIASAAAALSLSLIAAPAVAGDGKPTASIEYRDLDLSTVEGQRELDQRINRVAREICGLNASRTGTRMTSNQNRECYETALASVKKQVATLVEDQRRGG